MHSAQIGDKINGIFAEYNIFETRVPPEGVKVYL